VSEDFETDPLRQAVQETILAHPEVVQRWIQNQPGAWGFLAGQGILAFRRRLGRRPDDVERRALWQALWTALETLRGG
jgi:Asp-tRNA(Asn)/Glu-tRNA(Gln) amidotransferase B subunit